VPLSSKSLDRADRISTTGRVSTYLRDAIASGAIAPGDRIRETAVSGQLGVSRTPVREALAELARDGLVHVEPYCGAYVARLDAARLEHLVEFRIALEQFAVERAIRHAGAHDFDRVAACIDRLDERATAESFDAAIEADLEVHALLIEIAGNPLLAATYSSLLNELRLYIRMTSAHYASMRDLSLEHAALLTALRARDVDAALTLVRSHILHGHDAALKELVR